MTQDPELAAIDTPDPREGDLAPAPADTAADTDADTSPSEDEEAEVRANEPTGAGDVGA